MSYEECVRVAIRIRPQISREIFDQCHVCTSVSPSEPQIWLGNDKAFTFDHVFNMTTTQETVYQTCIKDLIDGCFKGLNATILAYGQTGSGKTYSMGTGFDIQISEEEVGIIPRAVNQLFSSIIQEQNEAQNCKLPPPEFQVSAQFIELYNEEIIDLLNPVPDEDKSKKSAIKIHEDPTGQILLVGLSSRLVSSASEALQCLKIGALSRTTASTRMNAQSSRSHAIFTLHIKQQKLIQFESSDGVESDLPEDFEILTSKLHFVDLAGSERLKRTGAIGDRAREGIAINSGLLILGNVISALGDKTRKATHVPYRDSKLTRLLQDSLGGNSQTLMIACISPSDRDFMESYNTLKYANRAKNIRNTVTRNEDKSSKAITHLRQQVQQLQLELMEYKEGKRKFGEDGEEYINDMFHENQFLTTENKNLRSRLKALQEVVEHQTKRVTDLLADKAAGSWITPGESDSQSEITEVIKGYLSEIENLRIKLLEAEEMCSQLRKQVQRNPNRTSLGSPYMNPHLQALELQMSPGVLEQAKLDVEMLSKQARAMGKEKPEKNGFKEEDKDDEKEKDDTPQDKQNDEDGSGDSDGFEDSDEISVESDSDEKIADETCDLAELTHDISIKQKLIEALEQSQQRLHTLKQRYEEKLQLLESKIKETEAERDRVLSALGANKENKSESKVKRVKEEFSNKLSSLQSELKKMQTLKKDHNLAMRNQAQSERKIGQLKNEVAEMKRIKVRLMNKIKEDTKAHLHSEQKRNREIAQLKKQTNQKENLIRNLESEKRMKENALKRKQEEIMALRKSARAKMSDKVAGRVPCKDLNTSFMMARKKMASPKEAKCRWQNLEKQINELVITRETINITEKDMNRYLKERERLTRKLESLTEERKAAILCNKSPEVIKDYDDNIETLKETVDYCQENITECQTTIVQIEEAKGDNCLQDVEKFVSAIGFKDIRYMLAKLVNMAINQTSQVYQKEAAVKELEAKLKDSAINNATHLELWARAYNDGNTEILDFISYNNEDMASESQCSTRSSSPIESSVSEATFIIPSSDCSRPKKRPRKTGLPSELTAELKLCNPSMTESCPSVDNTLEKPQSSRLAWSFGPSALEKELDLDKTLTSSPNPGEDKNPKGMVRVTSAPTSLQEMLYGRKSERSPLTKRRNREKQSHMAEFSPVFNRKFSTNASVIPFPSLSRQSSTDTAISDTSPPNSPGASRKNRDDSNVFNRLTSGSFRMSRPCTGIISPFVSKTNHKHFPLVCTHIAEGHSRAILSLSATNDVLFSASKDRTVKIWDLATGKELQSLGTHPNNVCGVRYNEYSRMAFTVSMAYIKIWDVRENPAICIQTLSSSGASTPGNPTTTSPTLRTLQMLKGEHQINCISLNQHGSILFSAADNLVRIWDLRQYKTIGKLSGGHQAAIMCLAVDNDGSDKNTVVTGSKDHYIKVFDVMEGTGGVHQVKTNLNPPHYDGIQSLAIHKNILFSGSRDMCIKKWNLKSGSHIQSLNQAHRDWINGLTFLPNNKLLSACRGGLLKLWDSETTQLIGEIKAHSSPINAIASNSSSIFTASSDCTVGIWRLRNNTDLSPDTDSLDV